MTDVFPILIPTLRIFPDFGRFACKLDTPPDFDQCPGKYASQADFFTNQTAALLDDWTLEFSKCAFADAFSEQHGDMLWISFDLRGLRIAKMIKRHIGDRGRVIYQKPIESPYWKYDSTREILNDGSVVNLHKHPGWHNLLQLRIL